MKYKAVFLDFYGTLVHEDDIAIENITRKMSECSMLQNPPKEIATYWWTEFRRLFESSCGKNFQTQRKLESISIQRTLEHFKCGNTDFDIEETLFSHWIKPKIFDDTMQFLSLNVLPVCIVSNIDRDDILRAVHFHRMNFTGIITSEDAKAYKPRREIFEMALAKMNVLPREALHVGDSLSSDVYGARNCGIDTFWLNRSKRAAPDDAAMFSGGTLTDVLKILQ